MRRRILCTMLTAVLLAAHLFTSCSKPHLAFPASEAKDALGMADSAQFLKEHHYWKDYNLQVTSDSMPLLQSSPEFSKVTDTFFLPKGTQIVVADILFFPTGTGDTIMVKVASEDLRQGWLLETSLFENAVPDEPISRFIHRADSSRLSFTLFLTSFLILFFAILRTMRKKIAGTPLKTANSPYPLLLSLIVAFVSMLNTCIRHCTPEDWDAFYLHPTLNPFALPVLMGMFVIGVWLVCIMGLAVIEDLRQRDNIFNHTIPLLSLAAGCTLLHLIFSHISRPRVAFSLFVAYAAFVIVTLILRRSGLYVCGVCGKKMTTSGVCPHCGTRNQIEK